MLLSLDKSAFKNGDLEWLEDEQLSNAGVVQDTYVLVKLFEKAGSGPKNGVQYGASFNEEEWEDDDIANCSNALVTVGPLEGTTAMEMVTVTLPKSHNAAEYHFGVLLRSPYA
nr:NAC domain-containing protein 82-like [Tanacetum cinerariifolium]